MDEAIFLEVQVDECEACPDGLALRFKRAGATVEVARVRYESDEGIEGWWRVTALQSADGEALHETPAESTLVQDSSEGTVRLLRGGRFGLRLVHEELAAEVRVPYLLLAVSAEIA